MTRTYYFDSRDITIIAISAAFWSILNITLAPMFWSITHLPFLCDLLAMISLFLVVWWSRKLGATTITGIIATLVNFALRPGAMHFLGFTAASIVFDVLTGVIGYKRCFSMKGIPIIIIAIVSAWIAGFIIGSMFLSKPDVIFFPILHAIGGLIGSIIGLAIIKGIEARGVSPKGGSY